LIRLAVFGHPVAQSLSPRIHRAFASQFGLAIDYRAIETTTTTFGPAVAELARHGGRGCNVTLPLKHQAWKLATRRSDDADRASAVNTLVFENDGWFGDNTDGGGLVADLEQGLGFEIGGRQICLVGAGGAARGVLAALLRRRPGGIVVANRSADKAVDLAREHTDLGHVSSTGLDALEDRGPFDLVINATSLGHHGEAPQLPERLFGQDTLCYDMNYGAAAQPMARYCEALGVRHSDGLGMLVGQAALSFRLWTGESPDPTQVLAALRSGSPASD
jgi:shikimate dehydrogenase